MSGRSCPAAFGSPCSMADRMRVTSFIKATLVPARSDRGYRRMIFRSRTNIARFGGECVVGAVPNPFRSSAAFFVENGTQHAPSAAATRIAPRIASAVAGTVAGRSTRYGIDHRNQPLEQEGLLMKRFIFVPVLAGAGLLALPGCAEKETTKRESTTTTPGGKTTVTHEKQVEKSGKNPPPETP